MQNINVGDRVAYLGNDYIELGTVATLEPDQDDGDNKAFTVRWDDGFNDEGYWNTSDSQIRPVKQ